MRIAMTALAIACTAAIGCGGGEGGDSPDEQVRKAARDYLTALAAGNGRRACATLTEEAKEQAVEEVTAAFATAPEMTCAQAVRELSVDLVPADERVLLNPKVGKVSVRGDRATVEVDRLTRPVPMQRVGDVWRVAQSRFSVAR